MKVWGGTFSPSLSYRLLVNYKGNNGNIIVNALKEPLI